MFVHVLIVLGANEIQTTVVPKSAHFQIDYHFSRTVIDVVEKLRVFLPFHVTPIVTSS